jgi:hypothetical protein
MYQDIVKICFENPRTVCDRIFETIESALFSTQNLSRGFSFFPPKRRSLPNTLQKYRKRRRKRGKGCKRKRTTNEKKKFRINDTVVGNTFLCKKDKNKGKKCV